MSIFSRVTRRTMKENKLRTAVTVIGVILSAAMFAAVTTFASSLTKYLENNYIYKTGNWQVSAQGVSQDELSKIRSDRNTLTVSLAKPLGYAEVKSKNTYKPYIYIEAANSQFLDNMPVHIIDGRTPKSPDEIILPVHLAYDGKVYYKTGDKITLAVGNRTSDGSKLNQSNSFDTDVKEEITDSKNHTYTVVGTYERPNFENISAPGYTALTYLDSESAGDSYDIFVGLKNPSKYMKFAEQNNLKYAEYNWDVLMFSGVFKYANLTNALYGFLAVFVFIIFLGSVSLIYSAFSISTSERTKQFGLLSSIGATKKQIRKSVFCEAFTVSAIGIPIGIICGIAGIGVTLALLGDKFKSMFPSSPCNLSLSVSLLSIIIAAAIALITVLVSAIIPARRATKVTAIEAIRQTKDISNKKQKPIKMSKPMFKLFGLEGLLAKKYFKRNGKKYRATIVSLALSITIFISSSAFCMYLSDSADAETASDVSNYDIVYRVNENDAEKVEKLYPELKNADSVTDSVFDYTVVNYALLDISSLTDGFIDYQNALYDFSKANLKTEKMKNYSIYADVVYFDDDSYKKLIKDEKLDESKYLGVKNPPAIVCNSTTATLIDDNTRKSYSFEYLKKDVDSLTVVTDSADEIEGYQSYGAQFVTDKNGKTQFMYVYIPDDVANGTGPDLDENGDCIITDRCKTVPAKTAKIKLGDKLSGNVLGTSFQSLSLVLPMSAREQMSAGGDTRVYFKSSDHAATADAIEKIIKAADISVNSGDIYNAAASQESIRNMITVINVFSYGFIILISLIAVANVFNTISTNIALRRRDFAMLRSVGMTKGGLNKMMYYECLLYGTKSIVFGLPAALIVTYALHSLTKQMFDFGFRLPWLSVAIAVVSVFAVVFVTMLYSMRKIKKDNTIDALKNENV